ncbi:preprotein translocase subunit SecE [Clostridium sp. Cult3]|uniref:preprotein translocase subunit SecE n=1 Tax=Clostridium sp. Cult3 TaxID=2079004 RepID=UPI001F006EAA|nr:preprotein translocase subunit SecE [Clostridium sp. Cult3]MCF6461410.1 preprotein translocase subunit SecE [Clostridium sp. Cult3]
MSAQTGAKKGRVSTYFKGVKAEMKKVIWPTKKELVNYTGVVVLISAIVGLVVWVLDLGIHRVLSLIIK